MITGIAGPTVTVDLKGLRLYEIVLVGRSGLTGEVVRLERERAVLQVYEDTRGLAVGEPVRGTARPLTAQLGPGLLGRDVRRTAASAGKASGAGRPLHRRRQQRLAPGLPPAVALHAGQAAGGSGDRPARSSARSRRGPSAIWSALPGTASWPAWQPAPTTSARRWGAMPTAARSPSARSGRCAARAPAGANSPRPNRW